MIATSPEVDAEGSLTGILIVPLETTHLQRSAADLYRAVFGYTDPTYSVSPRLLRGLLFNGGSALGALDENGRLVGFCYGYPGIESGRLYHFSQATVVHADVQGRGVGRALKLAQARLARENGATSMRWTFDPVATRNGHFNLDTLGARGIAFFTDFYGEADSDRMLVDWAIDRDPAIGEDRVTGKHVAVGSDSASDPGASYRADAAELDARFTEIAATSEIAATCVAASDPASITAAGAIGDDRWLRLPAARSAAVRDRDLVRSAVAAACATAFADGLEAVACRRLAGSSDAAYLFSRAGRSAFEPSATESTTPDPSGAEQGGRP